MLAAHSIVDSKKYDDFSDNIFRVTEVDKVRVVCHSCVNGPCHVSCHRWWRRPNSARCHPRRRTVRYVRDLKGEVQVEEFVCVQVNLEKYLDDVRMGKFPLTAYAPIVDPPNVSGGGIISREER